MNDWTLKTWARYVGALMVAVLLVGVMLVAVHRLDRGPASCPYGRSPYSSTRCLEP